jgi:hypothetical protein
VVGNSWMAVLSNELSGSCPPDWEIVAYLGDDDFLIRKRQAVEMTAVSESGGGPRTYKLAMWPNWKRILLPVIRNLVPWFQQEANQGWELVCHYEGAIFLFRKAH